MLTDAKVRSLRPDPAGEYVQGDLSLPGFGVRVRPTGAPAYVLMKRLPGETKPTRVTLGRVDTLTLAQAREAAREAAVAVKKGVDVNVEKRRDLIARKAERDHAHKVEDETGYRPGTFGETAIHYFRQECASLRRGGEVEAIIRRALLPAWGDRPLDALRRRDLTAVLDPLIAAGKVQAAHKLRELAIRVVNWAVDRGDIEVNFLATASRGRKRAGILRRTRRDRVLSDDEIAAVWRACDSIGQPFGSLIRVALLTGQRREEVAGMEWAELDLDAGLWTIPASRYKTGIEHAVPLPAAALDLIRSAPRVCPRFVFSTRAGTRFSGFSKGKARLDALSGVTGWRIHDLRRTLRTGLAGLRVEPDIAERVIGHVIGGVRGVYDRHAYADEKRDALERWAAHLAGIVAPAPQPGRVVRLRAR
ncbi:MAG TPA: integrase arm-type DNA-binding domain-containing protein [Stellaceae bacterium]|nr:integrase arm-type DNA-binding domain-containing protein [Stellaceae bacterium]